MLVAVGIAAVASLHLAAGFCLAVWLGYGPPNLSEAFELLLGNPPPSNQPEAPPSAPKGHETADPPLPKATDEEAEPEPVAAEATADA
ncbi:hypothetical protein JCM19992_09550 [Thermostilla marina]